MADYNHTVFSALTAKAFRRQIRRCVARDLDLDLARGYVTADQHRRDGAVAVRHGVIVNGRHIGYEAVTNGRSIRVTDLQRLDAGDGRQWSSNRPKSLPIDLPKALEDYRDRKFWNGLLSDAG